MSKTQDFLLTPAEIARVNARLAERTGGRVHIGPGPVLNSQAKAVWEASRVFAARKAAPSRSRAPRVGLAIGSAAMSLSGCAMLNPNVKGSFDCRAPEGTCSPTTSIDNRALAEIAGGSTAEVAPIGTYEVPPQEPRLQTVSLQTEPRKRKLSKAEREALKVRAAIDETTGAAPVAAATDPARTNERVLRIVFPAHVDRLGRYVEASAVHAVVERGTWLAADAGNVPIRSSERPSLTEFATSAPELSFPDLDGSRPGAAEEVETASVAAPVASAVPARSTPPGAPQLAPRAPGGASAKPVTAVAVRKASVEGQRKAEPTRAGSRTAGVVTVSTVSASVRGQLQALKPIVVATRSTVVAGNVPVTGSGDNGGGQTVTRPAPTPQALSPAARNLSPVVAAPATVGDTPSNPAATGAPVASARPPLLQTAPASANALVQAGVAAKLDEMRAAAVAAAKGAVASDQPANPPSHFSASGIDQ